MLRKEFKTIEEQLEILKKRGLSIPNEEKAKKFLSFNNYYRISGYSLTLRNKNQFSKQATFQNIIDIYKFDHEFRHLLLKYIEMIEVYFKSIYAHEFTKVYGGSGYLDSKLFTNNDKYQKIIKKSSKIKESWLPHELYLQHYKKLEEDIPLWAYVELLTISDISNLYKISEENIKKEVANKFGLTMKVGHEIMEKFMKSMTIIRNLCAHNGRLFDRIFEQKPSLNKHEKQLLIQDENGRIDNAHIYGFIIIMKRLLQDDDFNSLKNEIKALTDKYLFVNMKYYGFRDDWYTVL